MKTKARETAVRQALSLDAAAVYHVDYLFVRYRARLLKQPGRFCSPRSSRADNWSLMTC